MNPFSPASGPAEWGGFRGEGHARALFRPLFLLGFLFLTLLRPAKADLVFTNFSAAHPLKIMAVGDSITDDCSINGAWRQFLEPLLEGNGYPFTFVGRWSSTPGAGFTRVQHEGMCGAVIAPPGVMPSAVHGYAGGNVYLMKSVADALTNLTPDLVLIVIGANDIGHGRPPGQVAYTDLPDLLDLLFRNLPQANVIIDKATTLRSAVSGYSAYYTNIPIYNANLQVLVNARRAQGQNLSLADMYSVVDYTTGFLGDHLHPNATGLADMAAEFFSRIQAITLRTNLFCRALIPGGSAWNCSDAGLDLGTTWVTRGYDDSGWTNGPGPLGYGDLTVLTPVRYGTNSAAKNPTTYFRRQFVVPDNVGVTNLSFHLLCRDGAVVYLNGSEVYRYNLPAGPISYTNLAQKLTALEAAYSYYQSNLVLAPLTGTNEVAVEVHLFTPSIGRMEFDLELLGAGFISAPPALAVGGTGAALQLTWPTTNSVGFRLWSSGALGTGAVWTPWAGPIATNGSSLSAPVSTAGPQQYFRLVHP